MTISLQVLNQKRLAHALFDARLIVLPQKLQNVVLVNRLLTSAEAGCVRDSVVF